jgi:hypothetical protein
MNYNIGFHNVNDRVGFMVSTCCDFAKFSTRGLNLKPTSAFYQNKSLKITFCALHESLPLKLTVGKHFLRTTRSLRIGRLETWTSVPD